eukprot:TRINITY_DN6144_c0_g1_i1.p1 TRINITY_DN6144_c0_g1~~TRINITY_DN6144_c0_g1_i1.p1  ORF type:complete len:592 (+),score=173.84 TRINITY_DN6144_c0_g1_i1:70-1845(+)
MAIGQLAARGSLLGLEADKKRQRLRTVGRGVLWTHGNSRTGRVDRERSSIQDLADNAGGDGGPPQPPPSNGLTPQPHSASGQSVESQLGALDPAGRSAAPSRRTSGTAASWRQPADPYAIRLGDSSAWAAQIGCSVLLWNGDIHVPMMVHRKVVENLPCRRRLHALFEPHDFCEEVYAQEYAWTSRVLFATTIVCILISICSFCVESLPEFFDQDLLTFFVLECICIAWFTVELAVRLATCSSTSEFLRSTLNWVDIVSVIPFYVDLGLRMGGQAGGGATSGLVVLRVVRLTRVFRVFKLSKYNENVQLVASTLIVSGDALRMQLFLMTIATVLFGSFMFIAEQEAATFNETTRQWTRKEAYGGAKKPAEEHKLESIPISFWWAITTLTGVGYGDMYPVTPLGYVVGSFAIISGVLATAFPVIILGANFNDARDRMHHRRLRAKWHSRESAINLLRLVSADSDLHDASGARFCDLLDEAVNENLAREERELDEYDGLSPLPSAQSTPRAAQEPSPLPPRPDGTPSPEPPPPQGPAAQGAELLAALRAAEAAIARLSSPEAEQALRARVRREVRAAVRSGSSPSQGRGSAPG